MLQGVTLGAPRAQTRGKGFHPLHPNKRYYSFGKTQQLPLAALGMTKVRGLLAKESRENPRGKSSLFPGDYSQAFPGCEASGLAASPPGQKHNGVKSIVRVASSNSGNQVRATMQAVSVVAGPGWSPPWWGAGQRPAGLCPSQHNCSCFRCQIVLGCVLSPRFDIIKRQPVQAPTAAEGRIISFRDWQERPALRPASLPSADCRPLPAPAYRLSARLPRPCARRRWRRGKAPGTAFRRRSA